MRRAAKVDANQATIVRALRKAGAEVTHIHTLGRGVADLLVSYRQHWFVMELKDGAKPPSAQKLTFHERKWIGRQHAPVYIAKSAEEAIGVLQMVKP